MVMLPELLVTRSGAVRTVSLNRPDRLNAFDAALAGALLDALSDAAADPSCRAVLLRGEGRGFCSGQDLTAVPDGTDLGDLLETRFSPIIKLLRTMPKPVVCAVHGAAAGAGANLALACDLVLAGHGAKFIQAFVRIGLIPDVGGTWFLPRAVGDARARGLAMLGEPLGATQAEQWGLIWRAVPDDTLFEEAHRLAEQLAAMPTQALGAIKRALDASGGNTLDQQLALEAGAQRAAGNTPDFAEGVRAFIEKRPPRFTGQPAAAPPGHDA